jgi:hypothetical protein
MSNPILDRDFTETEDVPAAYAARQPQLTRPPKPMRGGNRVDQPSVPDKPEAKPKPSAKVSVSTKIVSRPRTRPTIIPVLVRQLGFAAVSFVVTAGGINAATAVMRYNAIESTKRANSEMTRVTASRHAVEADIARITRPDHLMEWARAEGFNSPYASPVSRGPQEVASHGKLPARM